jgi:hypothetical protein
MSEFQHRMDKIGLEHHDLGAKLDNLDARMQKLEMMRAEENVCF